MNGEIRELCLLTVSARLALKNAEKPDYVKAKYINSERFVFLPQRMESSAESAEQWFEELKRSGLTDVFMLLPANARNRETHGFINTSGGCILCFFDSGQATYFTTKWTFDKKSGWDIEFTEFEWKNHPDGKPKFDDNTDEFKRVLFEIAEFADKIGEKFWADIFRSARKILDGGTVVPEINGIPQKNVRLCYAADKADVFGAMGSWNDSPPFSAAEMGLSDEYDKLSNELFIQIQRALLYAVNEN